MQPPVLVDADPPALLAGASGPLSRARYRLLWSFEAEPGGCALQRVETTVRFLRGELVVVEYRAVYWEWFRFAREGAETRLDCHDFDLVRDGWGPDVVRRLARRLGRAAEGAAPARVRAEKRFLLGPGALEGERPRQTTPLGGGFGVLVEGEGEPSSLELTLEGVDARAGARPLPGPAAGRGRFTGPCFACREEMEWGFATLGGRVTLTGYLPS